MRAIRGGIVVIALLGVSAGLVAQSPYTEKEVATRIGVLKSERGRLQDELRKALSDDARLVDAPEGAVLIGLPTSLIESIISEAVTGPLRHVRLSMKDVVKVERSDVIRTRTFLGMMTLGHYALSVNVQEVNAVLRPALPKLSFGSNRIAIDLPVSVESGAVKARLSFKWDGRKLAGMVCGDLTRDHDLQAMVPRVQARMRGRFDVEARGERLFVKPVIAPIDLQFKVEPRQQTWDFIDDLIESKNAVCEAALRKAAVGQKVKDLVARGFRVRLPTHWLRPMTLPAAFRDTFDVRGTSTGLSVTPTGVSITKSRVWYGARLSLKKDEGKPARSGSGDTPGRE